MFYLNSTLNFGILPVFVFQLEVYCKVDRDRLLTGLTAHWYSNKTTLFLFLGCHFTFDNVCPFAEFQFEFHAKPLAFYEIVFYSDIVEFHTLAAQSTPMEVCIICQFQNKTNQKNNS